MMNKELIENNYLVIRNFISKNKALKLSEEYKLYCEECNTSGDEQVPNSDATYNYITFVELLCEKTKDITLLLGETVLPTYVYSRIYYNGSFLEKHKDRDACEISLTLNLDGDKEWPIYIETPLGEKNKVILNPGDAMMYLGRIAEHWRYEYKGKSYSQVFMHYVRSRGNCAYAYFDKLKSKEDGILDLKFPKNFKNSEIRQMKSNGPIIPDAGNSLEKYIAVFEDAIPENLCDEIIDEYSELVEWKDSLIVDVSNSLNKEIRNCKEINISQMETINNNPQKRKKIDKMLFEVISKVVRRYADIHQNFIIDIDTGYNLLKYDEGGFYKQHVDSCKSQQRSISCSLHLTDDYDGGEFAFFNRNLKYKCKKGSALIFPSNFMYPHEIMPVTRGTRYSIITWLI